MVIKKDMTFAEVLQKYPEALEVFLKHGLMCAMCGMAANETIEEGAKAHGINVNELIKELNEAIKNEKEEN